MGCLCLCFFFFFFSWSFKIKSGLDLGMEIPQQDGRGVVHIGGIILSTGLHTSRE